MGKRRKIILITVLVVVFTILTVLAIGVSKIIIEYRQDEYVTKHKITDVGTEISPDGNYEIIFQQVGEPIFFSEADIKITVKDISNEETLEVIESAVYDDGGPFDPDNWEVTWNEESVSIVIKSDEHIDQCYEVPLRR